VLYVLILIWYVIVVVQCFLNYGTAYRFTKSSGGSGVDLYGWNKILGLASLVPGLGVYFWFKGKELEEDDDYSSHTQLQASYREVDELKTQLNKVKIGKRNCPACYTEIDRDSHFCKSCALNIKEIDEKVREARQKEYEEKGLDIIYEDESFMETARRIKRIYGKNAYISKIKRKARDLGFGDIEVPEED